jgi:hypothetical protein
MTEDQAERIRNERVALDHMRRQARKDKGLPARLSEAIDAARVLSTAKAGQIGSDTARQKAESKEPPQAQDIDWAGHFTRIEMAIEHLEDAVDAERGLSLARDFRRLTTPDLDRELLKWEGVPSYEVCVRAPWLGGTPRTIENARRRLGMTATYGRKRDEQKAA